jgi:hypothetical protein
MRHTLKATLLGALGAVAFAPAAFAGCGEPPLHPASYVAGSDDAHLILANLGVTGIVGLWSFTINGSAADWGYQEWHSDGTEIINSGGHPPAGGNFCLGTWRQTGPNTYHLKHFPLAYNPATQALMFRIVVTEDVTIDATGNAFSGPVTEQVYDPTGVHLITTLTGTATGHRVLPN